jgi:hypothetical protein
MPLMKQSPFAVQAIANGKPEGKSEPDVVRVMPIFDSSQGGAQGAATGVPQGLVGDVGDYLVAGLPSGTDLSLPEPASTELKDPS